MRGRASIRALVCTLLALGCGARSGLDGATRDAAAPSSDAAFLVTFPCRWSLGLEVELGDRIAPDSPLGGAVPEGREEAVVTFDEREGALVSLSASPRRLAGWSAARTARVLSGLDGYVLAPTDRCALIPTDAVGAPRAAPLELDPRPCPASQSAPGVVELATGGAALSVDLRAVDVAPQTTARMRLPEGVDARVVSDPERGTIALVDLGGGLAVLRAPDDRVDLAARAGGLGLRGAALDRVRGAVVILYEHATDGFVLERVPFRGPLAPARLAVLPTSPSGGLTSNETEALVPLRDGTVAYVPLAAERLLVTEPVEAAPPARMELVLRPGGSAGGLVYTRDGVPVFRALVCNR